MLQPMTSCKTRARWKLPLTYVIATWSVLIMQTRLAHERALQIMRKLLSPCSPAVHRGGLVTWTACCRSTFMKLEHDSGIDIT